MVWIHGGGFANGSGGIPWYDGTSFSKRGDVVVVTINYRLGAFGFLNLTEMLGSDYATSGINGLLDQVAALEWIRDNISGFGSDPQNVTVFGESAGAMSIGTLMAMPSARGLFHHAIAQSGAAANVLDNDTSAEIAAMLLAELGTESPEALLTIAPENLITAQSAVTKTLLADPSRLSNGAFTLAMPFQPVIDGLVLPSHPITAISAGSAADITLISGVNRDEWNLFHQFANTNLDAARLVKRIDRFFGALVDGGVDRIMQTYQSTLGDPSPDDIWCAILTDTMFRIPAIRMVEAHEQSRPGNTFMYLFSWASEAFEGRLGACHALDLPFMWNILDRPGVDFFTGSTDPPVTLATAMHDTWWHFARTGRPDNVNIPHWPSYETKSRPTMTFGNDIEVVFDPASETRRLWENL